MRVLRQAAMAGVMSVAMAGGAVAQSAPNPGPRFDVVSIKVNNSGSLGGAWDEVIFNLKDAAGKPVNQDYKMIQRREYDADRAGRAQ